MSGVSWNDLGHTERDVYDVGEGIERLTAMLDALDEEAMTVTAVDGYLTALALLREDVPVPEWMAQVWSKDARFETVQRADLETALIGHYDRIAQKLGTEPGNYGPLLQEDQTTGKVIWDEWIAGFEYAVRLRPAAWARIEACKEPLVVEAVEMLECLYVAATAADRVLERQLAEVEPMVPALICGIVSALNARERDESAA